MVLVLLLVFFDAQVNLFNPSYAYLPPVAKDLFFDPSISGGRMGRPHGEEEPASCAKVVQNLGGKQWLVMEIDPSFCWKVDRGPAHH